MAHADYPPPTVFVASTTGTGLQPNILDASGFVTPGYPPVIEVHITGGAATVQVVGAGSISTSDPPTLNYPVNVAGGGITVSAFKDLVVGIPFYQINIVANAGTVTVLALRSPSGPGAQATPGIVRMTTNATQGL